MKFELIEDPIEDLEFCKHIEISPAELVDRFGEPLQGDRYEISGAFFFEDDQGQKYSIYDDHNTTLFDSSKPIPEHFWELEEPVEFSISKQEDTSCDDVTEFINFLIEAN